ncbi:MAG: hypothetical protein M1833_002425 [Piccolia ochrophora]|nr:MAG: hypothetical protein M1833_002425 [Piccolia ochrophora]
MARTTIATLKFVGTISLGLLTGVSYNLSALTMPSLLALPSATTAQHTFSRLQTLTRTHLGALTALSTSTLVLAYSFSPRRGRHPYLLWTALAATLSAGGDVWFAQQRRKALKDRRTRDEPDSPTVNGEEVRNGMERFRLVQGVRAGLAGLGFAMSVVGIWGDGY